MDKRTLGIVTVLIALALVVASLVAYWSAGTVNIVVAILLLSGIIFTVLTVLILVMIISDLALDVAAIKATKQG